MAPSSSGPIGITAFKPLLRTGKDQIWAFSGDDIALDGGQSGRAGNPAEFAVRVAPVVKGAPRIRTDAPCEGRLRLSLHDATGRMISGMSETSLAPGTVWLEPLSSGSGPRRLAPGAYFIRYQSELGQGLLKFTAVR